MAEDTLAALANVRPQRKPSLADLQALLALPQGDPRNDFGRTTGAARSVMHGAVVQPLQEMAHGVSDLATGQGFTPEVGAGVTAAMGLMLPGMRATRPAAAGIRAYHGSPHDFDKFDIKRIGTGEGAQAYGHGLYFAENEGVARSYREGLTAAHNRRPVTTNVPGNPFSGAQILEPDPTRPGRMYEVNINARPEQLLDWDKPLAQQPEGVRRALERTPWGADYTKSTVLTGGQIVPRTAQGVDQMRDAGIPGVRYLDQGSRPRTDLPMIETELARVRKEIQETTGGPRKVSALQLSERDLQQQLDMIKNNKQTYNYSIFDDSLIDILRKYGIALPAAGGTLAALGQEAKAK